MLRKIYQKENIKLFDNLKTRAVYDNQTFW